MPTNSGHGRTADARAVHAIVAVIAVSGCVTSAIDLDITDRDIERALAIARRSDAERARFHAPYLRTLNGPFLEQLEIVTEFRRMVLITEDRLRQGDRLFAAGLRAAREALAPFRGRVTLAARVRFDITKAYVGPPAVEIILEGSSGQPPLAARAVRVHPQYALGDTSTSNPIGSIVEADYDAAPIGQTTRTISVFLEKKALTRLPVDFASLE